VYEGEPSKRAVARTPQSLITGMNLFLSNLDVTFRRDPTNYRPRINKWGSTKDREQKDAGTYYYIDEVGGGNGGALKCGVGGGGGAWGPISAGTQLHRRGGGAFLG
jgi:hypothetical protein